MIPIAAILGGILRAMLDEVVSMNATHSLVVKFTVYGVGGPVSERLQTVLYIDGQTRSVEHYFTADKTMIVTGWESDINGVVEAYEGVHSMVPGDSLQLLIKNRVFLAAEGQKIRRPITAQEHIYRERDHA